MDHTQLSTFLTCPERYKLKFVDQLQKIKEDERDAPRQFGGAIHAALEAHYTNQTDVLSNAVFMTAYPSVLDPNDLARTPANGVILLSAYYQHYALQDSQWKVLAVEQVLESDIGWSSPWQSKHDLIVETQGGIWGVEHKTTAKPLIEQYWRQFEPNSQLSGQTYALQQKYGQCSGIILNAIKLGHRQRMYRGEPAGFHYEFQRQIFNRTPAQVEDWKQRTLTSLKRLKATIASSSWEKNEGACLFCEYRELCLSCDDEQIRSLLYQPCDALAYLKEGR